MNNTYEQFLGKSDLGIMPSVVIEEEVDQEVMPAHYAPARLKPKHKNIIMLHALGYTHEEIAKQTGATVSWISVVVNHPDAQRLTEEMTQQILDSHLGVVQKKIIAHADEMLGIAVGLARNARSEVVRLSAVKDIMDRAGLKAKEAVPESKSPMDKESAGIIARAIREDRKPVEEYMPIGNSGELEDIKNAVRDAEDAEELIHESSR